MSTYLVHTEQDGPMRCADMMHALQYACDHHGTWEVVSDAEAVRQILEWQRALLCGASPMETH